MPEPALILGIGSREHIRFPRQRLSKNKKNILSERMTERFPSFAGCGVCDWFLFDRCTGFFLQFMKKAGISFAFRLKFACSGCIL